MDWSHLAQDRDWWQAPENIVMTLWLHESVEFLDYLGILLACQELLYGVSQHSKHFNSLGPYKRLLPCSLASAVHQQFWAH